MKSFFRNFTKHDYIFFAICGIGYYLLVCQYLVAWDDLDYIFGVNNQYIVSFPDIIRSQVHAYTHWNGRFIVHSLVQLFVTIGGLTSFFICSSMFFVLLLMSTRYLLGRFGGEEISNILFITIAYLSLPQIGSTFYGDCAWTCNYMYSAAIYTFFLAIYYHIGTDHIQYPIWKNVLLLFFGIICGSWQESFSIGIGAALLLIHGYELYQGKGIKKRLSLFLLVLGFGIGACIGIFAPGNFCRFGITGGFNKTSLSLLTMATNILLLFKDYPILFLLCLLLVIASIKDKQNRTPWQFIKQQKLLLIAIAVGILFSIFVTNSGGRQYTMIILFSVFIILSFLQQYAHTLMVKYKTFIRIICTMLCLCLYCPSLYYTHLLHKAEYTLFSQMREHPSSEAIDTDFERIDRCVIGASPIRHYMNAYQTTNDIYDNVYFTRKLSAWISKGKTDTICTLLLPESKEEIIAHCKSEQQVGDSIYYAENMKYYILRLPDSIDKEKYCIRFQIEPNTLFLKLKYKLLRDKCYTIPLQVPTVEIRSFSNSGYSYYIFTHHLLYNASPKNMRCEVY